AAAEAGRHEESVRVWDIRRTHAGHVGDRVRIDESFGEWLTHHWTGTSRIEWEAEVVRTTWEAGPFAYPVALPAYVEERLVGGTSFRTIDGTTHVLFGPWQV